MADIFSKFAERDPIPRYHSARHPAVQRAMRKMSRTPDAAWVTDLLRRAGQRQFQYLMLADGFAVPIARLSARFIPTVVSIYDWKPSEGPSGYPGADVLLSRWARTAFLASAGDEIDVAAICAEVRRVTRVCVILTERDRLDEWGKLLEASMKTIWPPGSTYADVQRWEAWRAAT